MPMCVSLKTDFRFISVSTEFDILITPQQLDYEKAEMYYVAVTSWDTAETRDRKTNPCAIRISLSDSQLRRTMIYITRPVKIH